MGAPAGGRQVPSPGERGGVRAKRPRPTYPRVECLAPGCRRGTTRIKPHADGSPGEWVCADHWRTVPKAWRQRLSLYGRRYRAAVARGDDRAIGVAARCWWRRWEAIKATLCDPADVGEGDLPITMGEELRRLGL